MELIGRIVPAIRETRIPLITGYAWVLAIWLIANRIIHLVGPEDAPLERWTPLWAVQTAFGTLSALGAGIALTVVAFLVGSGAGYLWDKHEPPVYVRALRDPSIRIQSEAQLRMQLAPPLAVGGLAVDPGHLRRLTTSTGRWVPGWTMSG